MLILFVLSLGTMSSALAAEASLFPLSHGNRWIYRDSSSGGTFTIDVRTPVQSGGRAYYSVHGYAAKPELVREGEDGWLYRWNDDLAREEILTSFDRSTAGWYTSRINECDPLTQVQQEREEYRTTTGDTLKALRLRYRNFGCPDSGIEEELYVENIGLVRRTVGTIAGPRTFDLIYARTGAVTYEGQRGTSFRVSLDRNYIEAVNDDPVRLVVTLRISQLAAPGYEIEFPSSQLYDIVVRDEAGEVIYQWSEGQVFAEGSVRRSFTNDLEFTEAIEIKDRLGRPLKGGYYSVEAWLNTPNREFASATKFFYSPPDTGEASVRAADRRDVRRFSSSAPL